MNYIPQPRSNGTIERQRLQLPWPDRRPFRILSIDGGGICGILPVAILAEVERKFLGDQPIGRYFDLVAGTSTGGIIALGLGHSLSARQILNVYMERGGIIFPPTSELARLLKLFKQGYRTIYERQPLESELLRMFGETTFGESSLRLVIPAFEGRHGEPWLFKTPHHPDYRKDRFERMVKVGLATSAAPSFFEAVPNNGFVMVDGGIWANNPVMNALVDALACFTLDRRQIRILSLGCGETAFTVDDRRARGGFLHWWNVIQAAMRAQSLNALGQAYLLVGKDQVLRLGAPASGRPIALDDYRRAQDELPKLARSLVEAGGREIERLFLSTLADPFVACGATSTVGA